ncbi:unnamed protein product [Haemonchus placei]|uniref:Uncharacterized protein n=1 Tax=Haemonchus placei TaxID=6290 RepID=A0A0N4WSP0_HAEPC|nr:unnamed protein product [Haemonchus placei]
MTTHRPDNIRIHKYYSIVLCACLCRISEASEADVLAALKAQQIPEEAQTLSGEPLVEYLNKNQNLFEESHPPLILLTRAAITPVSHGYKHKLMDLKFIGQKRNIVVEDEKDFGDDIPERLQISSPIQDNELFSLLKS